MKINRVDYIRRSILRKKNNYYSHHGTLESNMM